MTGLLTGGAAVTTVTATGSTTSRTLADRFAEVHNVKDFGATGDGSTDDLDFITAAINWQTSNDTRGVIYFPPGTYYVRAPIDFSGIAVPQNAGLYVSFLGEMGLSTIVGDFADYVLKRGLEGPQRWSGPWSIDRLTIINRHAGGGGIRFGAIQAGAIRDCNITADIAINDDNSDSNIDLGGNINGAFELIIENCNVRPYNTLATSSIGIYKTSDGPVTNCTMVGFDNGMCTSSGQGGAAIQGCYFEGNNYGFRPGHGVEAWATSGGGNFTLEGCHFKNNGIAITGAANGIFRGVYIEAATGSISGNPQYGMSFGEAPSSNFKGISISGDFQQYGVSLLGGENIRHSGSYTAVGSLNSVSSPTKNWALPSTAMSAKFTAINTRAVVTMAQLPAFSGPITSISWRASRIKTVTSLVGGSGYVEGNYDNVPLTGGSGSGGTVKLSVSGGGAVVQTSIEFSDRTVGSGYAVSDSLSASNTHLGGSGSGFSLVVASVEDTATVNFTPTGDPSNLVEKSAVMTITGVTPSGYNGAFVGTIVSGTQIQWPLTPNPGSSSALGTVFFTGSDAGMTNAYEGETYNVSDANTATWGAPVTAGGGSNHIKVRFTPAAWTVVGK